MMKPTLNKPLGSSGGSGFGHGDGGKKPEAVSAVTGFKKALLEASEGGGAEEGLLMGLREEIQKEAKRRGTEDLEAVTLRLLDQYQRETSWLRQEKASLLAQLERAQRVQSDLQGRLSDYDTGGSGVGATAQGILDSNILSARLSVTDKEQAKAVVDLLKQIHSFGVDSLPEGPLQQLQVTESKRALNRALRYLVLDNQFHINTCIWEVIKFTDRQDPSSSDAVAEPNIQIVFIEGESLIFRIIDMRLQPRDVYVLCSLDGDNHREHGGWGLQSLFAVSDTPIIFSSPFQLRLDAASRGPQGILCPEWVPSVDATSSKGEPIIPPSYQARIKDNCTFVYAPLRESAKELLRATDMEPFEGLSLAFLNRLRKVDLMLVSYEGPAEVKVVRNLQHEVELFPVRVEGHEASAAFKESVRVVGHRAADCTVRLTKTSRIPDRNYQDDGGGPQERYYRLHDYHIGLGSSSSSSGGGGDNQEITRITLAFPLDQDQQPLLREKRRRRQRGEGGGFPEDTSNGGTHAFHTEALYSQVPIPYAGKLPFALHADFDLTADMLGLQPTSAWNHWLLSCMARLFVLSFLTDAKLRNYVDQYVPQADETPSSGLWYGVLESLERLLQMHMFVKTESDLMVPRAQAVLRPRAIGREFISDELLREVTKGRKHFADITPGGGGGEGGGAAAEGAGATAGDNNLRSCPMEVILQCTERLIAAGKFREHCLAQLWAYLIAELPKASSGSASEDDGNSGNLALLSPSVQQLLQEVLAIYPVQGRALRTFRQDKIPIFLSISKELEPVLRMLDGQLRSFLVPVLDTSTPILLAIDAQKFKDAVRIIGARDATVDELQTVIRRVFEQQLPAVLSDADRFWALRSLVVEGLGAAASLREFLGEAIPLSLPVLELKLSSSSSSGSSAETIGGVIPRLVKVEYNADVSERFILPTFLGVTLGPSEALLQKGSLWGGDGRTVIKTHKSRRALLRPPSGGASTESNAASWSDLVTWENGMHTEVGIDGGSNRNWPVIFEWLSPAKLAKSIITGLLNDAKTSKDSRQAFSTLLDVYLEQYAQVFESMRAANRPSNAEILQAIEDPVQSQNFRFSKSFVEACLCLPTSFAKDGVTQPNPPHAHLPSFDQMQQVLPVQAEDLRWCPEAVRFQEVAQLAIVNIDSLYAIVLAMYLLTKWLESRGELVQPPQQPQQAQPVTVKAGCEGWAWLLLGLFRKAIENLCRTYGHGIRNRKRKRPGGTKDQEEDVALFQGYCKQYGLWLSSRKDAGATAAPSCVPVSQVVWSVDDPISRFLDKSAAASRSSSTDSTATGGPPILALDKELSGLLETEEDEEGAAMRDMIRRFFTESLGVTGEKGRQQLLALLEQGLERWAQHPGPMPRDVEELYRTIGEAAASTSSSPGLFGFDEIPVLNLNHQPGALAVVRNGNSSSSSFSSLSSFAATSGSSKADSTTAKGSQPLVGISGSGDSEDGALHWFYREFFPSRCLHPSIRSLLKLCSPTLLPHLNLAKPRQSFIESYAETTSSMVSIMRAMNVDLVKTVKIVAEVYGESHLPVTELARYWATARELRDLVLEELWKMDGDPVPRNEELIEAVKNTLQVPLCPKTGKVAETSLQMANALKSDPPIFLGSVLGIDLELQDRPELPCLVKHPAVSRESTWHRAARPEDGFQAVEQSCYWERFLLALGVKPLEESHIQLISIEVLNKVFLALAKFNGLLNGPDQTVASQYNIWHSYHYVYREIDGNKYVARYKEVRAGSPDNVRKAAAAAAAAAAQQQQQQDAFALSHQQHPAPFPLALQASHSGTYYDYSGAAAAGAGGGGYPAGAGPSGSSGSTTTFLSPPPPHAFTPGGGGGFASPHGGPTTAGPSPTAGAGAGLPPPPPPILNVVPSGLVPPPVKRQRSQMSADSAASGPESSGGDTVTPAPFKVPRLLPPVPPQVPKAPPQEEGEIEEGEIEG